LAARPAGIRHAKKATIPSNSATGAKTPGRWSHLKELTSQNSGQRQCAGKTKTSSKESQSHSIAEPQDIFALCAQRHSDPYLLPP
jgi:hypothetical protein